MLNTQSSIHFCIQPVDIPLHVCNHTTLILTLVIPFNSISIPLVLALPFCSSHLFILNTVLAFIMVNLEALACISFLYFFYILENV